MDTPKDWSQLGLWVLHGISETVWPDCHSELVGLRQPEGIYHLRTVPTAKTWLLTLL